MLWKIIHMSSATEREDLVKSLETMFQAIRFEAVKGEDVKEKYKSLLHPVPGQPIGSGIFGCFESHYRALKELSQSSYEYVGVLEDDCYFTSNKADIDEWLESLPEGWDVALLGTTEHVRSTPISTTTSKVTRFWGTHAVLFRRTCLEKVFQTYEKYLNLGTLPVADWWYAWAIQEHNLKAFAPNPPTRFCYQKEGFISYITGKERGLPKNLPK